MKHKIHYDSLIKEHTVVDQFTMLGKTKYCMGSTQALNSGSTMENLGVGAHSDSP